MDDFWFLLLTLVLFALTAGLGALCAQLMGDKS
jgi:hypothetical protein